MPLDAAHPNSPPPLPSAEIKARAIRLGFSGAGIVPADRLGAEQERLNEWIARGFHGEMNYMARDPQLRTDPRKLFPEARSLVVVTLNYYTPHQHSNNQTTGKVSRYAWGDDYHDVVGEKLRALLAWIKEQRPETEGKICVDIQPTMDKAWAVRAGLGWIGKHTNVITPASGSWVFIGELILNLELEYDREEVADQCGSCTLCIDACPPGAIVEPYVVDANLCISHATIESRAPEIDERVREHMEGWLYGCDICQDVCPWNHAAATTSEPRFEPRAGNINRGLSDLLAMTPEDYAAEFRRSAMKRAKLAGLQRNARALMEQSETRA